MRFLCHVIWVLSLIEGHNSLAQGRVTLSAGYGIYTMSSLESFQRELALSVNTPVVLTEGSLFPGYLNFELGFRQKQRNLLLGVLLGYGSTGARTGYSDFSGYYYIDQEVNYWSASGSLGYSIELSDGRLLLEFDSRPGVLASTLEIIQRVGLGSSKFESSIGFRSLNFVFQPSISVTRKFSNFGLEALIGYQVSILKGNLSLIEDRNAFLLDKQGNKLSADWAGFRAQLAVSFFFSLRKQ